MRPCFCHDRIQVGQPEVNVGLFPAAGGTRTLARVVGFKAAVEMITTGRMVLRNLLRTPLFLPRVLR